MTCRVANGGLATSQSFPSLLGQELASEVQHGAHGTTAATPTAAAGLSAVHLTLQVQLERHLGRLGNDILLGSVGCLQQVSALCRVY